jgi:hypothetical protein
MRNDVLIAKNPLHNNNGTAYPNLLFEIALIVLQDATGQRNNSLDLSARLPSRSGIAPAGISGLPVLICRKRRSAGQCS